jgi:hypothetical protein
VLLEAPPGVVLERATGPWAAVCTAPCDRDLPIDELYRVTGSGIRMSEPFRIEGPVAHLVVNPASSTRHGLAVASTVTGVLGVAPVVLLTVGAIFAAPFAALGDSLTGKGDSFGKKLGQAYLYVAVPAVVGAALLAVGTVTLQSSSTRVTLTGARPRPQAPADHGPTERRNADPIRPQGPSDPSRWWEQSTAPSAPTPAPSASGEREPVWRAADPIAPKQAAIIAPVLKFQF